MEQSKQIRQFLDEFSCQLHRYFDTHYSSSSNVDCPVRECNWPDCEDQNEYCYRLTQYENSREMVTLDHPLDQAASALCEALGLERLPTGNEFQAGKNYRKILVASGQCSKAVARREGFLRELLDDPYEMVWNAVCEIQKWIDSEAANLQHIENIPKNGDVNHLSDRQLGIIRTLNQAQSYDCEHRLKRNEIAQKMGEENTSAFGFAVAELNTKYNFTNSKGGRDGGVWLAALGREHANELL